MAFDCYIRRSTENDKVIFPKMFCRTDKEAEILGKQGKKIKSLEAERRAMNSVFRFMCQFYNDPIDESTIEFKRDYIHAVNISGDMVKQLAREPAIISIDPAIRLKETNDRTGIVVTKPLREQQQIVVLEATGKRISVDQLVDEIFRLTKTYYTERVLIETFHAQLWLVKILKDEMVKRGQYFTINEVKGSTRESKAARIRGLIPYYANHRVLHRIGLDDLEAELIQFPRSKHDDIIDALAYQILYWKEILTGDSKKFIIKHEPFTVDWFKSRMPKYNTAEEKIFKGIIKRRPTI